MIGETVLSGAPFPKGGRLEVMESPAGYYLGFRDETGEPYSRETEYMEEYMAKAILGYFRQ